MALWAKATLFSYITPSFRPQMARYASRFTRYELCSLLEQSLPGTPSRLKQNQCNLRNLRLKNSCLYSLFLCVFCAFLWLKNPRNLRNPRLINDLRDSNALYNCRETFTDVMSALQIKLFLQNEPKSRKVKFNVNKVLTTDYDQMDTWSIGKNEPKTNPNEPKTNPILAQKTTQRTQTNPKQIQFQRQKNPALHLFAVGYLRKRLYSVTV